MARLPYISKAQIYASADKPLPVIPDLIRGPVTARRRDERLQPHSRITEWILGSEVEDDDGEK